MRTDDDASAKEVQERELALLSAFADGDRQAVAAFLCDDFQMSSAVWKLIKLDRDTWLDVIAHTETESLSANVRPGSRGGARLRACVSALGLVGEARRRRCQRLLPADTSVAGDAGGVAAAVAFAGRVLADPRRTRRRFRFGSSAAMSSAS